MKRFKSGIYIDFQVVFFNKDEIRALIQKQIAQLFYGRNERLSPLEIEAPHFHTLLASFDHD